LVQSSKTQTSPGLDFQGKTLGQLAPEFSDLVTSNSISVKSMKS